MIAYQGDLHGDFRALIKLAKNLRKGDTIFLLGDVGIGWLSEGELNWTGNFLKEKSITCYAYRGNHDFATPFKEGRKWGNINLLPDFSYLTVEGVKHFCVGGAVSVDRFRRIEGKSWWRDEKFPSEFGIIPSEIDVVLTHTCPRIAFPVESPHKNNAALSFYYEQDPKLQEDLNKELDIVDKFKEEIFKNASPSRWFFGHFHCSSSIFVDNCLFKCLNIEEVDVYH